MKSNDQSLQQTQCGSNDTIVQDDSFGLVGIGSEVGLKAGPVMPADTPVLHTLKTINTTAVINNHLFGAFINNLWLDGNGRTVDCKGWVVGDVTGSDFRGVNIRQFAQEDFLLNDSARESEFWNVHLRGCGDAARGIAAAAISMDTPRDGHHNLHFYGFYSIYAYGIALDIKPKDNTLPTRVLHFYSPMFHGMTSTGEVEHEFTYSRDWRHSACPLVRVADARSVKFIAPRFHSSGHGQPHVLICNNATATPNPVNNSVAVLNADFGTARHSEAVVTADPADHTLTGSGILLGTGALVRVTSTDALPGGLAAGTDDYAIRVDDNTVKLATSRDNAEAGAAVDLTSAGAGSITLASQDCFVLVESIAGALDVLVSGRRTDAVPNRSAVINKAQANRVRILDLLPDAAAGFSAFEASGSTDHAQVIPGPLEVAGGIDVGGALTIPNNTNLSSRTSTGAVVPVARVTGGNTVLLGNPAALSSIPNTSVRAWLSILFATQGVERGRFDQNGNLVVGAMSVLGNPAGSVGIANAAAPPAGTPAGGGVLYVEAGALKFMGSSGTVTTIAPA